MTFSPRGSLFLVVFLATTIILIARQPYYGDRIIIYVDNKVNDFTISDDQRSTNLPQLNDLMIQEKSSSIQQWLFNARATDRDGDIYLNRYYVIQFESPKDDLDRVVGQFTALDQIRMSDRLPIIYPAYIPNDSLWDQLYHLPQVKADLAYDLWDIEGGDIPGQMDSGQIVVAIPDIGLKWDHPDLIDNIWQNLGEDIDGDGVVIEFIDGEWTFDPDDINGVDDDVDNYIDNFIGYDPANLDNDPYPMSEGHVHGTRVAGNISAITNNTTGIASIGYSVKLMGINANDDINDPNTGAYAYHATLAAAHMGADIINCSWVSVAGGEPFYGAFNIILNQYGCISVAAAGNGSGNGGIGDTSDFDPWYPAGFETTVAVTALGANNTFNCWANVGEHVDIGAPGEYILCTNPRSSIPYILGTGTSYATPLTSGAFALVKSVIPNADIETIISKVVHTADHYPDMERSCGGQSIEGLVGSGQLNIHRAILACSYPELVISDVEYQTTDGFFSPGDTIVVNVTVRNNLGWEDAENVVVTLSTDDLMISIIEDQFYINETISSGEERVAQFILATSDEALLGDYSFGIHFSANSGEIPYENDVEFLVSLSLGLYGFPIESVDVKSSPTIADLDGNILTEIYFGSGSMFYGKWIGGLDVNGFPFNAGAEISTGTAVGDLDGDGDKEVVFGTSDGAVYALTKTGTVHMSFQGNEEEHIVDVPVLSDLDQDGDLEIIAIASNHDSSSSSLIVLHDDGEVVDSEGYGNFNVGGIDAAPAIADLDNDMALDIVVVTLDGDIHVLEGAGAPDPPSGPFSIDGSFRSSPTLVDLDGDQDLEIIIGNDNGELHVLHHDGSSMSSFDTEGVIHGGVSVADLDGNGSMELLFTGDDEHLHAWDPIEDTEPVGWPIDLGKPGISEPVILDMDNDGDLEVICVSGFNEIHLYHHDGTPYGNFPYVSQDSIRSTPAIGDLDNDGDFELIVGTSSDLRVIDIAQESGDKYSWSTYRGNHHRDGYFDITLASTSFDGTIIPTKYVLDNNYPNPFNPITRFTYSLPKDSRVKVTIHDINGRIVKTLIDDRQAAGKRSVTWNAKNDKGLPVATGLYFYRMESGDFQSTKKMILLK